MIWIAYILCGIMIIALFGAFIGMINPKKYDSVKEEEAYDNWLKKEYGEDWFKENIGE